MLLELTAWFPLAGHVITADALHTQREFTETVCEKLLAHYVLTVKRNQKNLHEGPRRPVLGRGSPARHQGQGPRPRRAAQPPRHGRPRRDPRPVLPRQAGRQGHPHPHRHQPGKATAARRTRVTKTSTETVYLITSLTAREAAPEHIAAYIRSHWGIENQVHWVRDVTLREDSSKVSAANRPANLATLRNAQLGAHPPARQQRHRRHPARSQVRQRPAPRPPTPRTSHSEQQQLLCPQPWVLGCSADASIDYQRSERIYHIHLTSFDAILKLLKSISSNKRSLCF